LVRCGGSLGSSRYQVGDESSRAERQALPPADLCALRTTACQHLLCMSASPPCAPLLAGFSILIVIAAHRRLIREVTDVARGLFGVRVERGVARPLMHSLFSSSAINQPGVKPCILLQRMGCGWRKKDKAPPQYRRRSQRIECCAQWVEVMGRVALTHCPAQAWAAIAPLDRTDRRTKLSATEFRVRHFAANHRRMEPNLTRWVPPQPIPPTSSSIRTWKRPLKACSG
jgi:hypothetical protein